MKIVVTTTCGYCGKGFVYEQQGKEQWFCSSVCQDDATRSLVKREWRTEPVSQVAQFHGLLDFHLLVALLTGAALVEACRVATNRGLLSLDHFITVNNTYARIYERVVGA